MNTEKRIAIAPCPDCEHEVKLGLSPKLGEKFTCPTCWAYLEVINLDPLELAWDSELEDAWETKPDR